MRSPTTDPTVLVIGAAGLVGSHVAAAFDRERVIRTFHREPLADGYELDILDHSAVRRLIGELRPSAIVLAAAEAWVERCEREPEATRLVNVEAARSVAACAAANDALFIAFSSEYVFDGSSGPYSEADPVSPLNEYGRQKVALEEIARGLRRHLICRTSGVFGHEPAGKNFVVQLVNSLRSGMPFKVPNDQEITPTYAPDLALALRDLVRMGSGGTFNVVGRQILKRSAFAQLCADAYGLSSQHLVALPTDQMGHSARRPLHAGLSDAKLRAVLGRSLRGPVEALADLADRAGASPGT